ncbi:zinc finger protein ZAT9-like [Magnolia sinica]|uniref:zinc finger protein ZAT9-like n=1 Tax=Magnolia sinica TaxID=86752 RepID=UPI00265A9D00|nr:zinc finger protein ZAT9-like [Magnolia sinica]
MAVVMDQQQIFKHYCRICKKGFGCGRALGGHMRAHGIGDEVGHADDDDHASDWEDKLGGNPQAGSKRMYALRTNPNRLKSCRSCENCGKEFVSWKSFLEHGKCSSDDAESLMSEPAGLEGDDGVERRECVGWLKGKRSRRVLKVGNLSYNCCPSSEEEELAHCLVMLSAAQVDPLVAETEESCASASKEEERQRNSPGIVANMSRTPPEKAKAAVRGVFECKACKKVFNSHQALGGHRASHKKVKGCFAARLDDLDESNIEEDVITHDDFSILSKTAIVPFDHAVHNIPMMASKRKSKVHECSICHRIFASGQALGGHKRCHWVTSNSPDGPIAKLHHLQDHAQHLHQRAKFSKSEPLDLNQPAPIDDHNGVRADNERPLNFEVPMALYLQQWIGMNSNSNHNNNNNTGNNNNNNNTTTSNNNENNHNKCPSNNDNNNNNNTNNNVSTSMLHVDDEADSKIKIAKLSDLKDMNMSSGSSPWLQVGIGSAADGSNDP